MKRSPHTQQMKERAAFFSNLDIRHCVQPGEVEGQLSGWHKIASKQTRDFCAAGKSENSKQRSVQQSNAQQARDNQTKRKRNAPMASGSAAAAMMTLPATAEMRSATLFALNTHSSRNATKMKKAARRMVSNTQSNYTEISSNKKKTREHTPGSVFKPNHPVGNATEDERIDELEQQLRCAFG
jgi:hypothetical protein